jgi:hypothetical protein
MLGFMEQTLDIAALSQEFETEFPAYKNRVFILDAERFSDGGRALAEIRGMLDAAVRPEMPVIGRLPRRRIQMLREYIAVQSFDGHMPRRIAIPSYFGFSEDAAALVVPGRRGVESVSWMAFLGGTATRPDGFVYNSAAVSVTRPEQWRHAVLDHELAHALGGVRAPGTRPLKRPLSKDAINHGECFADSYAVLRHLKREGARDQFPLLLAGLRSAGAWHGDIDHYTSRAVRATVAAAYEIERRKPGGMAVMTGEEMRALAARIADASALSLAESSLLRFAVGKGRCRSMAAGIGGARRSLRFAPIPGLRALAGEYLETMLSLYVPETRDAEKARDALSRFSGRRPADPARGIGIAALSGPTPSRGARP